MAINMKKIILIILISFITLQNCTCEKKPPTIQEAQRKTPPVNFSLIYVPGATGDRAALILKILNKTAMDAARKQEDLKIQSSLSHKERLQPFRFTMNQNQWLTKLSFYTQNQKAKAHKINDSLTLIEAPQPEEMELGPHDVYQATFALNPSAIPPAGAKLYVVWQQDDKKVTSNKAVIPTAATTDYGNKIRQANVANVLKDVPILQKTSSELIQMNPEKPEGYWFQGLAYELKKDYKKALESIQTARRKIKYTPGPNAEPPVVLMQKVRQLKEKL